MTGGALHRRAALLVGLALVGCAHGDLARQPATVTLPLSRAWFNGQVVEYIVTDVSDAAMAAMMGAHHVPRLRAALGADGRPSLVDRVYKFADESQVSVFESAPEAVRPGREGVNYSPLWRVVEVRWLPGRVRRELQSEEEVLAAQERGELQLTVLDVVVNCPVIRGVDGVALRGVR
jgi:hypothetical protein